MSLRTILLLAAAGALAGTWARWASLEPEIDRETAERLRRSTPDARAAR